VRFLPFLTLTLHAQLLTNPVQDFINRTTLLNNILSNSRAVAMSQKAQSVTAYTPTPSPAPNPHLDLYEQTARKDGFPPHDIAYALEYFLVNSYMTWHHLHDVPPAKDPRIKHGKDSFERITLASQKKTLQVTPYQERATYEQLKTLLNANPAIAKLTEKQKQEMTEALATAFGINCKLYLDAVMKEDDTAIEQARQQARANLERLTGVPVARLRFTNTGLQIQ
jgi:hypothetical protein